MSEWAVASRRGPDCSDKRSPEISSTAEARSSQVTSVCSRLPQQSWNKKMGWEGVRSATNGIR